MCQERPELRADIGLDRILDLDREWSDSQAKGRRPIPNRMFFYTLCKRPLTPPPPLVFTQSCCGFLDMTVKKCVNICRDRI